MTIKYTQEQAFIILEAFRATISDNTPIYVRVRSYGKSKTIARPFVPSTSTVYSAGFETPLECREHVIKELAKMAENKMYEGENCRYNEDREDEKIRNLIGKCIEVRNYEKAMRLAVSIKDKTLIAFITRLIHTSNKVY